MQVRDKSDQAMLKEIEDQLKRIEERGSGASLSFARAIRGFVTALQYPDAVLRESRLETVRECFTDLAEEMVSEAVKESKSAMSICETCVKSISGGGVVSPNPKLDEYGEKLQVLARSSIKLLTRMQSEFEGPFGEGSFGEIVLSGMGPLQNELQRWREFDNSFLKPWPWTSRERKPVDREMLAEAKRSRERGETGTPVGDLINKLMEHQ